MIRKIAISCAIALGVVLGTGIATPDTARAERVYDAESKTWKKKSKRVYRRRAPAAKYRRRNVSLKTSEAPGTIIVDTKEKFLYYVKSNRRAIRYGIGVGREGFGWSGTVKVAAKKKWPSWTPPPAMVRREWVQNKRRVGFMKGGPRNPLGARSLYLFKGARDTQYRIHGTNEPWSIGLNMSSGCIRMLNKDVEHLYERASVGAKVIVIGPDGRGRKSYSKFRNPIAALFGN